MNNAFTVKQMAPPISLTCSKRKHELHPKVHVTHPDVDEVPDNKNRTSANGNLSATVLVNTVMPEDANCVTPETINVEYVNHVASEGDNSLRYDDTDEVIPF